MASGFRDLLAWVIGWTSAGPEPGGTVSELLVIRGAENGYIETIGTEAGYQGVHGTEDNYLELKGS